jgi:FlaA1/EpsC-like NDP-sugar epimerase
MTESKKTGGLRHQRAVSRMLKAIKKVVGNRALAILHDLAMIPVAWLGAYWLRFNLGLIPANYLYPALENLAVVIVIQAIAFHYFGLYRGVWRFASLPDLIRIMRAVLVGVLFSAIAMFLISRMEGVPRSIFPLYGILLVALLGSSRMMVRWSKDRRLYRGDSKRVLIVGAGKAGEMLVRDLLRTRDEVYEPVGFVDDSITRWGRELHGVRVLGSCDEIADLTERLDVDLIVLAIPSANSRQMRRLVSLCEKTGVPFRTLPPINRLMSGEVRLNQLREVSIEDLLGREPVSLDWNAIGLGIAGKKVLVTGAGGSIGSELCRQIARLGPAYLMLLDNCEFNLYAIELELLAHFPRLKICRCLNDVVDQSAVQYLFQSLRPEIVFHAAAYKQVPMLEDQVREAVKNNIQGTRTVAEAADRFGCETFVMISTDKAVNPANVMGASKRAAEIFCQNLNKRSHTRFITVRFGNVLDSAGSVVPLFRQQIAAGGPVTVTHREITRYFMTIPEACLLILQASAMGRGGEIFVLDMGQPIKISYLAEQMIMLSGKVPGEEIEIIYTGLRPGEKLYEELFHEKETLQSTPHEKILLAKHRQFDWQQLTGILDGMEIACNAYDENEIRNLLSQMVPEWVGVEAEYHRAAFLPVEGKATATERPPVLH